jgi:hypothetical protein
LNWGPQNCLASEPEVACPVSHRGLAEATVEHATLECLPSCSRTIQHRVFVATRESYVMWDSSEIRLWSGEFRAVILQRSSEDIVTFAEGRL